MRVASSVEEAWGERRAAAALAERMAETMAGALEEVKGGGTEGVAMG